MAPCKETAFILHGSWWCNDGPAWPSPLPLHSVTGKTVSKKKKKERKDETVLPPRRWLCRVSVTQRRCSSASPSLSPGQSDWSLPTFPHLSRELLLPAWAWMYYILATENLSSWSTGATWVLALQQLFGSPLRGQAFDFSSAEVNWDTAFRPGDLCRAPLHNNFHYCP